MTPSCRTKQRAWETAAFWTWRFRKGLLWFRGYYRDYEGTFSESYTNATYVWVLGGWVRVWRKSTTA